MSLLRVSLFQISEIMRTGLITAAAKSSEQGVKKSINDCIIEALEQYVSMDVESQPAPAVEGLASRKYTVRTNDELKNNVLKTSARWQIKLGIPVPMNAVVNKAINLYLGKFK